MQTILLPIQSQLPALLGAPPSSTAWVITITVLVGTVCSPVAGRLGDMYGKRRIVMILLAQLTAGSIVCAVADSLVPVLIGRALQGAGLGVVGVSIAVLRDLVPRERLGSAIALVSATVGVGSALALPLSAFIAEGAGWHVLFALATLLGVCSLAAVAGAVPPDVVRSGGRFDCLGAVGLTAGLTCLLLGISQAGEGGAGSLPVVTLLGTATAVLLVWGWATLRNPQPLVDLRVSARRPVLLTNLAGVAMGFAFFASSIVFPQLLQLPTSAGGVGLTAQGASFALMPLGVSMLAAAPLAGRITRRFGPKPLLIAGAAILAAAYLFACLVPLGVWHIGALNAVIGIGIGFGFAAMPTLLMTAVPVTESASANGLNTLMRSLGMTTAAAVIGTVIAQSAEGSPLDAVPGLPGFTTALLLSALASCVCILLASFIPVRGPQIV